METRRTPILVYAGLSIAIAASGAPTQANLLVDPSFEANALTGYANVLTNFVGFQGIWGAENGAITGFENGVTPAQGFKMLRMDDDGLATTQAFQVTDVTSYAGAIDAGAATLSLNALFNVDTYVPAAVGGVYIQFFSASNYGSQIGTGLAGALALDNQDTTWEAAALTTTVPVGTRWLLSQVYYSNASLIGNDGTVHPGYVDSADLRLVPEPSTLGLLATGALAMLRRRNG